MNGIACCKKILLLLLYYMALVCIFAEQNRTRVEQGSNKHRIFYSANLKRSVTLKISL